MYVESVDVDNIEVSLIEIVEEGISLKEKILALWIWRVEGESFDVF